MRLLPVALVGLLALLACAAGKEEPEPEDSTDFTDDEDASLDLLFVVDNSNSMQEEAASLAVAFDGLEDALADAGVSAWRAGVTTSSVYYDDGPTSGIDAGEAGTLIGGSTVDTVDDLRVALLCHAVCWDNSLPTDASYVCGDPLGEEVSEEYLDCLCGVGDWEANCGTGIEQPIEAAYMALCRAAASPPEDCYTFPDTAAVAFEAGDEGSNTGLDGASVLVILMSDEGDSSPRTVDGSAAVAGDVEGVVTAYTTLFDALELSIDVSTIGPAYDGVDGGCLDGAQEWGVERYQQLAVSTGGVYEDLTALDADCAPRDMGGLLAGVIGG